MNAAVHPSYRPSGVLARAPTSPQVYTRLGGLLYLIIIAGGLFGETFVRSRLIVPGDAAATAGRILASEPLWRLSIGLEFFMLVCTVALTLLFYLLFRPVSRDLALLAVFFNLVSVAVEATNELNLLGSLLPLAEADYLRFLDPELRHALAQLPIDSYGYGFGAGLIFFGCECLLLGYLIYRSGFLPRILGVLMFAAGLSYLTNSFAMILSPSLAAALFPAILLPALVGEASLCLWLLVRGVNVSSWRARAT